MEDYKQAALDRIHSAGGDIYALLTLNGTLEKVNATLEAINETLKKGLKVPEESQDPMEDAAAQIGKTIYGLSKMFSSVPKAKEVKDCTTCVNTLDGTKEACFSTEPCTDFNLWCGECSK